MRGHLLGCSVVFLAGCGAAQGSTENSTGGTGTFGGGGGAAAATTGGTENPAGGGGMENGGSANACVNGTMPDDAVRLEFDFVGALNNYPSSEPNILNGSVFVERVESGLLYLVDETGRRLWMRAVSPSVSFANVAIGTKFWLSAYARIHANNPYNFDRFLRFSLRTDENGPILFASLQGMKEEGDLLLGVPLSFPSRCSFTDTSDRTISSSTGERCTYTVEQFAATIDSVPLASVSPGTRVSATINENSYDLALWSASSGTYSDASCPPADGTITSLYLELDVVARDWQELSANQPIETAQLPACRLGLDSKLLTFDLAQVTRSQVEQGSSEYEISAVSSLADTTSFSLASHGTVRVTGVSPEGQAVLERGRWFSISDYDYESYVIRESEGGPPLAVMFSGALSKLNAFMSRSDLFGLSVAVEPRCEWMSSDCRDGNTLRAFSLYDVTYGDNAEQRIASHERGVLAVSAKQFDAWVAVGPSCLADPYLIATFLARE